MGLTISLLRVQVSIPPAGAPQLQAPGPERTKLVSVGIESVAVTLTGPGLGHYLLSNTFGSLELDGVALSGTNLSSSLSIQIVKAGAETSFSRSKRSSMEDAEDLPQSENTFVSPCPLSTCLCFSPRQRIWPAA